jgi:hypothetical protein
MNLEKLNLVELNAQEISEIDGGWWVRALERVGAALGVYDAISDFKEGWNSVKSPNYGAGAGGSW